MTRIIPGVSQKPLPPPLAMSNAPPDPLPSMAPDSPHTNKHDESRSTHAKPLPSRPWPRPVQQPKLRLQVEELAHQGAVRFFEQVKPGTVLSDAVTAVHKWLYTESSLVPPVRSITLFLQGFGGVAYTKGMDLDDDHKEIHFSHDYIAGIKESNATRLHDEIYGVIVHEMVHVWQWNGQGTCPGGLIEGIADFVRLRAGLSPPHWKREKGDKWDAGYEKTAYFLEWLEAKYGQGTVVRMNGWLRHHKYDEKQFWHDLFDTSVDQLWGRYQEQLEKEGDGRS